MKVFWIDLFSGAGGTTTGIHLTEMENVKVVACVNHDAKAIESHKANHPDCLHFVEDVRDFKVVAALRKLVTQLRHEHTNCIINIWASLECTNYSKAKGGLPRDADSRTLAYALYLYTEELKPDYTYIENVREFMAWGPLDEKGRPISRKNGRDYIAWIKKIQSFGYNYEWQLLNAADFGAYTSRERYFGIFAQKGLPIEWPEPTHSKNPSTGGLFSSLEKWKPVRDVLELDDEGQSIFDRKKPLVEATLQRIHAGLIKFVAGGSTAFTKVYNSGNELSRVKSIDEPVGTLTTQNSHAIVKCAFLNKNFSGHPQSKVKDLEQPAGTITCKDHHSIVQAQFLNSYYGNGGAHSTNEPCPTLTTKDRFTKVFIDKQYGTGIPQSIEVPAATITNIPKLNVVSAKPWLMNTNFNNTGSDLDKPSPVITANRKWHYLLNPQFASAGSPIDKPCFTLIARMDKRPPYVIEAVTGQYGIVVYKTDSHTMVKIKEFMALYGIVDIKMRMLKIPELLKIQGFPDDYILKGNQADQKKFIGNAVVPVIAKKLAEANINGVRKLERVAV